MENKIITAEYQQATELHSKIMANAEIAASALLEMCQGLKEMRDKKLYLQLDMPTFDTYCEDKVGIKARQAYTYISTYEKLGSTVLQSNANLGITKLELIAQLPAPDRAAELADGTFDGMSVKEIKELVRKNKEQAEQLDLLLSEKQEIQSQADEDKQKYFDLLTTSTEDSLANKNKIDELNRKIAELENQPTEVAVRELTDDERAVIRKQITAEVRADFDAQLAKSKEKLKKLKADKKQAMQNYKDAQDKIAELQKQAELADPVKAKIVMLFDELKNDYNNMMSAIAELSQDSDKVKFTTAVQKTLQILLDNLGG